MDIQINVNAENANAILEDAMKCISQIAKDAPQWEKHKPYGYYQTECDVSENDIVPIFNELIAKYPELDIFAVDSQTIREDDRSAQWWNTTKFKTEHHPDGTTTLKIDSSTHWF